MSIFDKVINIGTDWAKDLADSIVDGLEEGLSRLISETPEQEQQQEQQQIYQEPQQDLASYTEQEESNINKIPILQKLGQNLEKANLKDKTFEESGAELSLGYQKNGPVTMDSQAAKDNEESNKEENSRELNPQFIKNDHRITEIQNGISDTGAQRFPIENDPTRDLSSVGNLIKNAKSIADNNPAYNDPLYGKENSILNPNNWSLENIIEASKPLVSPIFSFENGPAAIPSNYELYQKQQQNAYRSSNPLPENAFNNDGTTSDEFKNKYKQYYGELEQDYETGINPLSRGLMASMAVNPEHPELTQQAMDESNETPFSAITTGLDKIAHENYDDGTKRLDSVKSKYMSGKEYKEHQALGMGGRPSWMIDDNATYNKLDEMRDWNYIPFIDDQSQLNNWNATQIVDNVTKSLDMFNNARDRYTQEYINYGDQKIDRDQLSDEVRRWVSESPTKKAKWVIPTNSGEDEIVYSDYISPEVNFASNLPELGEYPPGTIIMYFPDIPNKYWTFTDKDDYNNTEIEGYSYGLPVDNLEYTQWDGNKISLTPQEYYELVNLLQNGDASIDYGLFGKNANERKDMTTMLKTLDPTDLPAATADLVMGSAPLWYGPVAWPTAAASAGTSLWGLDPRSYNSKDNTWRRLAGINPETDEDRMTGERYLSNIALSGLQPFTERVAGVLGGSHGIVGKPIQTLMQKFGAPALIRMAADVGGEGLEEIVAQIWEEYQQQGADTWYGNPVYQKDEFGNILYDSNGNPIPLYDTSGHQIKEHGTDPWQRALNSSQDMLENFLAGSWLGTPFTALKAVQDKVHGTGYFDESNKKYRNMYGAGEPGQNLIQLGPEDIGTYGERR